MKTTQFCKLRVIVPKNGYSGSNGDIGVQLVTVGLAQSVRVEDSFGTKQENVIGSPFPVFHPGFQSTTISVEKATVDGYSFRNLGAFNPLWAHLGSTYNRQTGLVNMSKGDGSLAVDLLPEGGDTHMFPFMFILSFYDEIADSYANSSFPELGKDSNSAKGKNILGSYCCVLNTASTSLSSQNAVIMDNISAYARPLSGTWFSDAIRQAYQKQNGTNGMDSYINSMLFGYFSENAYTLPSG